MYYSFLFIDALKGIWKMSTIILNWITKNGNKVCFRIGEITGQWQTGPAELKGHLMEIILELHHQNGRQGEWTEER